MLVGMVPPLKGKYKRTPLDPKNISLFQHKCCQLIVGRMDMNQLLCWDEFAVLVEVSWKSATSPQIVQCTHAENERVIWWMPQPTSSLFFFLSRLYHKYSAKTMNKLWPDIQRAINQKCNDLRKKQTQWL